MVKEFTPDMANSMQKIVRKCFPRTPADSEQDSCIHTGVRSDVRPTHGLPMANNEK